MKRHWLPPFGLGICGCLLLASAAAQQATRTPTPAPRLSGGFGRPRAETAPTPAAPSGGQSLADVVQAAREPREVAPAGKTSLTISNHSLVKDADKGRVSTSKAAPPPHKPAPTPVAAGESGHAPTPVSQAAAAAGAATGGTEAEWRERAQSDRKRVVDGRARVAELTATVNKLENDFYAWDDGQYRDRVIKPAWDRARSELETAKEELAKAEKELADLPEKARRAGALPGWTRE